MFVYFIFLNNYTPYHSIKYHVLRPTLTTITAIKLIMGTI